MRARLVAVDARLEEALVRDLETPAGTLPHARLRLADALYLRVPAGDPACPLALPLDRFLPP